MRTLGADWTVPALPSTRTLSPGLNIDVKGERKEDVHVGACQPAHCSTHTRLAAIFEAERADHVDTTALLLRFFARKLDKGVCPRVVGVDDAKVGEVEEVERLDHPCRPYAVGV
eukprot:6114417-Prymnesium_polylepis.1